MRRDARRPEARKTGRDAPRVADQRVFRRDRPIGELQEFLSFLEEVEQVGGRVARRPRAITGQRFLL